MSKKLRISALMAVVMVILALVICLAACNPTSEVTHKVKTTFESSQGDVVLTPEAQDGIYKDGTEVTVTVSAKSGYEFDSLTVSTDPDAALDGEGKYTFKVTADTTITVLFRSTTPTPTDCEHTNLSALVPYKAPTCTEQGVVAHYHCNDCNKDLSEDKSEVLTTTTIGVDPTAHNFGAWEAEVPATCTDEGTAAHKDCTLCHKHFDADGVEIPASEYTLAVDGTAHRFGALQSQQDATCGVDGVKAHKDCELCHKHFTEEGEEIPDNELSIPATNAHTFDKYENCGDEGHKVLCSVCDKPQTGDVTQHTYSGYVADGQTGHHQECVCGYHTSVESHTVGAEPAYSNDNEYTHTYTCDKCNVRVTEEHSMDDWKVDGEGKHYHGCVCGRETEHGEHTFGESPVYTDAGDGAHHTTVCTVCHLTVQLDHSIQHISDGVGGHHTECELCDYKTQTEGHKLGDYLNGVGVPGGGSGGVQDYHYKKCSECPYETPQEGCKYEDSEWQMTDTECWKDCSVCGHTCSTTPAYKKQQHNKILATTSKTNETPQHWTECSNCKKIFGEKVNCVYEHKLQPGANDNATRYHGYYCTEGSHWFGLTLHNWDSAVTYFAPKPGDEANKHVKVKKCTECEYVYVDTKFAAAEHNWGDVQTDDEGKKYYVCSDCQYESEHKVEHIHKWTVTDEGWYEGDGICEGGDGCTESIFTISKDGSTITGLTANIGEITKIKFPGSINGKIITTVGGKIGSTKTAAFPNITEMKFSESITTLGKYAFEYCALTTIDLPDTIVSVGSGCFQQCKQLLTASTNVVGSTMFNYCDALTTLTLREKVTATVTGLLTYCTALKTINFQCAQMPTIAKNTIIKMTQEIDVYFNINQADYDESKIDSAVNKDQLKMHFKDEN